MTYYIMFPGDRETDTIYDSNILGERSFNSFYSGRGLISLKSIINHKPELLPLVTIKTDTNKTLTVEEFLTEIQTLKIY
jgi:hypothetical protein